MFREMRKKTQSLPRDKIEEILKRCTAGVLGVHGDDGYPYTVPMTYIYKDNKLLFHCAKEGHKLDSIEKNNKVSFSVIDKDEIIEDAFTSHYRSVTIFGKARIISDENEKQDAMESVVERFSPDFVKEGLEYIKDQWDKACVFQIDIEHMTGKVAKDMVN